MSSDIVSHNVSGILLTLWLTLWEDCEEIVSGDEYPYCLSYPEAVGKNVRRVTEGEQIKLVLCDI